MVVETDLPGMNMSYFARQHGIGPGQLLTWRTLMAQGALTAAAAGEEACPRPTTGRWRPKYASYSAFWAKGPERTRSCPKRCPGPQAKKVTAALNLVA